MFNIIKHASAKGAEKKLAKDMAKFDKQTWLTLKDAVLKAEQRRIAK